MKIKVNGRYLKETFGEISQAYLQIAKKMTLLLNVQQLNISNNKIVIIG